MKISSLKNALFISLLASLFALSACQEKGPAEKAGEKLDNMVEDSKDAIKDAGDDIEDAVDEAAEDIKDATN